MQKIIKEALDLFAEKGQVKLSYLGKHLNISDNDSKLLTNFLIDQGWLQEGETWGRDVHYSITKDGETVLTSLLVFEALDKMMLFMQAHSYSSHEIGDLIRHCNVPDMQIGYETILYQNEQVVDVMAYSKDGPSYVLNQHGKELIREGGFTARYGSDLDELYSNFVMQRNPVPLTQTAKVEDLHDDMLRFLKRKHLANYIFRVS